MADMDMVSKAEVLDIYAELYDKFDYAPGVIKMLHKVYDKINRLQPTEPVEPQRLDWEQVLCALNTKLDDGSVFVVLPHDVAKAAYEMLKEQKQIVRCKDCKHGALFAQDGMIPLVTCNGEDHELDWFCADGERR